MLETVDDGDISVNVVDKDVWGDISEIVVDKDSWGDLVNEAWRGGVCGASSDLPINSSLLFPGLSMMMYNHVY